MYNNTIRNRYIHETLNKNKNRPKFYTFSCSISCLATTMASLMVCKSGKLSLLLDEMRGDFRKSAKQWLLRLMYHISVPVSAFYYSSKDHKSHSIPNTRDS